VVVHAAPPKGPSRVKTTSCTEQNRSSASLANKIGDSGAVALADALKTNTSVTKIRLNYNKIGPDGKRALGEVNKPYGRVRM
jgi:hypothetical protein